MAVVETSKKTETTATLVNAVTPTATLSAATATLKETAVMMTLTTIETMATEATRRWQKQYNGDLDGNNRRDDNGGDRTARPTVV